ncbi:elongation factor 1-gamma [Coccinella septempunctata]|uniref:elongation factor 1-gamma n=1 Tax=Coccinella septempunctata TaxID=41139 RepID=UPI001D0897F4|nr:elongation factor 1-gamma [Coccinella septempunctata]
MAAGTLYTYPDNFRSAKALIAAQYAKANVKVEPNFILGETNKSKDFLKKFPSGKVPAFESKDGLCLQESNSIAYYVANEQLRGKSDAQRAEILQWMGFAESEVLPSSCAWIFPILGIIKPAANTPEVTQALQRAKEDLKQALVILNNHLLSRTYLVGERITLADIVVFCNLLYAYKYAMDPEYRKPFINLNRWFETLANQPEFKAVIGETELCSKPAQVTSCQAAGGDCKKKNKQQQPAKKEEKKEEEEKDAADEILAAEPASKNPFDSMPKGTFVMDDFKKSYSNEDESVSIPYFWDKFDPENYSIWFCEYKYPEELSKVFMSCNLITGMFQRLDKMRKAAFSSMCLFGEDNNSSISGVWVWRGQDLAFPLCPDWQIDYESYDWKKLDPKDSATKELVKQYFSWTGTDKSGRKFNQGKIFK